MQHDSFKETVGNFKKRLFSHVTDDRSCAECAEKEQNKNTKIIHILVLLFKKLIF